MRYNAVNAVLRLYKDSDNVQGLRDFRVRVLRELTQPYGELWAEQVSFICVCAFLCPTESFRGPHA